MTLSLDRFKELVPDSSGISDVILQFILDTVEEKILNYCNIEEIPDGLENTAYMMCIDEYGTKVSSGGSITSGDSGEVKKITTGDTTVEFNTSSSTGDSGSTRSIDVVDKFKKQLQRYRKVVF